jgi:hypothetical protein
MASPAWTRRPADLGACEDEGDRAVYPAGHMQHGQHTRGGVAAPRKHRPDRVLGPQRERHQRRRAERKGSTWQSLTSRESAPASRSIKMIELLQNMWTTVRRYGDDTAEPFPACGFRRDRRYRQCRGRRVAACGPECPGCQPPRAGAGGSAERGRRCGRPAPRRQPRRQAPLSYITAQVRRTPSGRSFSPC